MSYSETVVRSAVSRSLRGGGRAEQVKHREFEGSDTE
jgi:hypothetical protein